MAAATNKNLPQPPDQFTTVDQPTKPGNDILRGVAVPWHEWFTRLWRAINDLYALIAAITPSSTVINDVGTMVPYFIASGSTFTVPLYKQGLFSMTIDVEGILIVDGFLIQVD